MNYEQAGRLSKHILQDIDVSISQLMRLRTTVEKIVIDCSKLQEMAGVSTPALDNGTEAAIAMVLGNRAKTVAKRHK